MEYTLISALAGVAAGPITYTSWAFLTRRRTGEKAAYKKADLKIITLWSVICALGFAAAAFLSASLAQGLYIMFCFSICLCLAAVDLKTRRLPNSLLILLFLAKTVYIIAGPGIAKLPDALIGMAVLFIIFLLPVITGKQMGIGDAKFAAVAGYTVGAGGLYLMAAAFTVSMVLIFLGLLIFGKGGLKTVIPMGPVISASILIPLFLHI